QYLVNRSPVRRTDLVELLADVGLGGSMGSIISQGRVEEILGSKPEERRQLVEEAAGLGRFKQRRHRAELKLARVATDVERARDPPQARSPERERLLEEARLARDRLGALERTLAELEGLPPAARALAEQGQKLVLSTVTPEAGSERAVAAALGWRAAAVIVDDA